MIINEKHDGLTIENDDIFVEKLLDEVDSSVITVWFTIESRRTDSIRFRLSDPLPDGWSPERVGFHPNHEPEHWEYEDGSMVFEREFEPEEEHTTIYALRVDGPKGLERFKSIPRIEVWPPAEESSTSIEEPTPEKPMIPANGSDEGHSVDPALDMDIHPDDPDWVKEMKQNVKGKEQIATSLDETDSALDDSDDATGGVGNHTISMVGEGAALAYEQENEPVETINDESQPADEEEVQTDDLLHELIEALESNASSEDRGALREALGIHEYKSLSTRVDHLHKQHGELAAYTDALREFIDEEGTGVEIVETLREQRDELAAEMESIDERLDEVFERQEEHAKEFERTRGLESRVDERLAEVASRIDDTLTRLDELERAHAERLERVRSRVDTVETEHSEQLAAVKQDIEEIEAKHRQSIASIQEDLDKSMNAFETRMNEQLGSLEDDLSDDIDELGEDMEEYMGNVETNLSSKVDRLDSEMSDAVGTIEEEIDTVDEDLSEVEDDLESVLEWRAAVVRMFTQD